MPEYAFLGHPSMIDMTHSIYHWKRSRVQTLSTALDGGRWAMIVLATSFGVLGSPACFSICDRTESNPLSNHNCRSTSNHSQAIITAAYLCMHMLTCKYIRVPFEPQIWIPMEFLVFVTRKQCATLCRVC